MSEHSFAEHTGGTLKIALVVTGGLVAAEFITGILSHSLALVGDGWHNLADLLTLAFASLAFHWQHKPPDTQKTFGYGRIEVLAAFANALILMTVAVLICHAGYERLLHPPRVNTRVMLAVGVLALAVNGGISLALARRRHDLNLRAIFLSFGADALANFGIIIGALLMQYTGARLMDPIVAFLIAGMLLWSAAGILFESGNILLEGMPKGMTLEAVARSILAVSGVREVHDIHIWSLGSNHHALSCHVHILDMSTSSSERIAFAIRQALSTEYGIHHSTIQFEHTHPPGDFHRYMPDAAPRAEKKQG